MRHHIRPLKNLCSLLLLAGIVAGCAADPSYREVPSYRETTLRDRAPQNNPANNLINNKSTVSSLSGNLEKALSAPLYEGNKNHVALLLPLTHENARVRTLARDMFNAALLALFDTQKIEPHNIAHQITLSLHDTHGTTDGAKAAMQAAIDGNAQLVIGPLFAYTAQAISPLVRTHKIPTLTFSNDRRLIEQQRPAHLWLLGFLPDQNMERVSRAAIAQGLTRFGALVPDGDYGTRTLERFQAHIERYGGEVLQAETYPIKAESMFAPVRSLARFESRRAAYETRLALLVQEARTHARTHNITLTSNPDKKASAERKAKAKLDSLFAAITATAPHLAARYTALAKRETEGEIVYDAIFIPEGGLALRSLAPLLPYYDIDPRFVKFIGTSLWDDAALAREPALHGGWYAAPETHLKEAFVRHFNKTYQYNPPRLAALAYDSVALAARLASLYTPDPFTSDILTDPNGFRGIEGIMRLTRDGANERGLAIYEITAKKPRRIAPAPANFVEHDRDIRAALSAAQSLNQ